MPKQTLQQKIRRALGRFTAKRIAMILLGTAILSFGIHNIHRRTAITEGGVIGLVLLINHWLGVPASVASPLLDAASYALAFKFLGWDFLLSAGVASVSLAGFYRIWECLPPMLPDLTPWPLAAALLGGVFVGVGVGLIVRQGGSSGGDDALALVIHQADRVAALPRLPVHRSDRPVRVAVLHPVPAHRVFPRYGHGVVAAHRLCQGVAAENKCVKTRGTLVHSGKLRYNRLCIFAMTPTEVCDMKLTRKLAALAMAVLLAVSLTACSPKQVAQDMVVHLVHKLGLVEESDEDDTDTTTKAPAGGSVEFPAEMDTTAARVVTYPVENTLYVSFNGIANRSTEYFVAGGDSMTVTGYATTEASNEKYMYFKIAFWELSDDKTMTSYVPDSTIYYCADGADYQYNVTGLTAGKQYKITISYDNGNKYYVTGGLKVEGLGSTELNTYGDDTTTG